MRMGIASDSTEAYLRKIPKRPERIISLWSGFSSSPQLVFVSLWFLIDAHLTLAITLFYFRGLL